MQQGASHNTQQLAWYLTGYKTRMLVSSNARNAAGSVSLLHDKVKCNKACVCGRPRF